MYTPPPDPGNQRYWNQEAKYRKELASNGGLTFALIRLLGYLAKGVAWLLILPLRLPLSWWPRRRHKRAHAPLHRRNEI